MVYGLWLSAAGLQANQYRQDVIANNLANVETTGFKRDLAVFTERRIAAREGVGDPGASQPLLESMTGGTFVAPTVTSYEQGRIDVTNRALDLALEGDGFFRVRDGGRVVYTRDGRFAVNEKGELVTVAGGRAVLNDRGVSIQVPPNRVHELRFSEDGTIRVGEEEVATLGLADFADKSLLRKVGANLFEAPAGAKVRRSSANVRSGAIEASTVDPTTTMVDMIEASRAYQLNASLISLQDATLGRAANDIARVA